MKHREIVAERKKEQEQEKIEKQRLESPFIILSARSSAFVAILTFDVADSVRFNGFLSLGVRAILC
jgi:hypothetical protein